MKTPPDSALADAQGIIADLRRQVGEAHAQQTAAAEVLQVIDSSPGDLDAVQGVLWSIDGENARPTASRGVSPGFVEQLRRSGETGTNPLIQRTLRGERLIRFVDTAEEEVYREGNPIATEAVRAAGVRSLIIKPPAIRRNTNISGSRPHPSPIHYGEIGEKLIPMMQSPRCLDLSRQPSCQGVGHVTDAGRVLFRYGGTGAPTLS